MSSITGMPSGQDDDMAGIVAQIQAAKKEEELKKLGTPPTTIVVEEEDPEIAAIIAEGAGLAKVEIFPRHTTEDDDLMIAMEGLDVIGADAPTTSETVVGEPIAAPKALVYPDEEERETIPIVVAETYEPTVAFTKGEVAPEVAKTMVPGSKVDEVALTDAMIEQLIAGSAPSSGTATKAAIAVMPSPPPTGRPSYLSSPPTSVSPAFRTIESLDTFVDADKFRTLTQISPSNISKAAYEQHGTVSYWSEQFTKAERQFNRVDAESKVHFAMITRDIRQRLAAHGVAKVTDSMILEAEKLDPRWLAITEVVNEARAIKTMARGCLDSMETRTQMIIQLSKPQLADMRGGLRVSEQD